MTINMLLSKRCSTFKTRMDNKAQGDWIMRIKEPKCRIPWYQS